jgi:hypothetical protein
MAPESFKISPDPLLIDKIRDVVRLYLAPPDGVERHRPALQMDQDRRPDQRAQLPLLLTHLRTG